MLGEAGATVYCTGRSVRGGSSPIGRPETIEETAEMVTAHGGIGLWARVDHGSPDQVKSLFDRVRREKGRLDILVNNMSGDQHLTAGMLSGKEPQSFWDYPIEKGLATQQNGVHTHLITSACAAPLMVEQGSGLIVEITDGNRLAFNGVGVAYSLSKTSLVLLAYLMSQELKAHNVAVVSLTPGWLRSETMLDGFGVTEENWRDAIDENPDFAESETPFYIGRAVVALATDPQVMNRTGHALSAGYLAREYGFTDVDGRQPPGYAWGGVDIREGIFRDGRFLSLQDELVVESN
jgi:NAD(P)-dependent dehydrogenase (short-subunit alcohol dehydrogenase family)